jgi:hypothetical protein
MLFEVHVLQSTCILHVGTIEWPPYSQKRARLRVLQLHHKTQLRATGKCSALVRSVLFHFQALNRWSNRNDLWVARWNKQRQVGRNVPLSRNIRRMQKQRMKALCDATIIERGILFQGLFIFRLAPMCHSNCEIFQVRQTSSGNAFFRKGVCLEAEGYSHTW